MTRLRIIAEFDLPGDPDTLSKRQRDNFNAAVARIIPAQFGIPGTLVYLATCEVERVSIHNNNDAVSCIKPGTRMEFEP